MSISSVTGTSSTYESCGTSSTSSSKRPDPSKFLQDFIAKLGSDNSTEAQDLSTKLKQLQTDIKSGTADQTTLAADRKAVGEAMKAYKAAKGDNAVDFPPADGVDAASGTSAASDTSATTQTAKAHHGHHHHKPLSNTASTDTASGQQATGLDLASLLSNSDDKNASLIKSQELEAGAFFSLQA